MTFMVSNSAINLFNLKYDSRETRNFVFSSVRMSFSLMGIKWLGVLRVFWVISTFYGQQYDCQVTVNTIMAWIWLARRMYGCQAGVNGNQIFAFVSGSKWWEAWVNQPPHFWTAESLELGNAGWLINWIYLLNLVYKNMK